MQSRIFLITVVAIVPAIASLVWRANDRLTNVFGACGYPRVTLVNAQQQEVAQACSALRDVVTYFGVIGHAFDPVVEIEFGASVPQDHVWFRAHGWFDARALTVRLNDSGGFLAWGVRSRGLLAKSFLTHELVHLALHLILGARDPRLPLHWHEFVAYAVQFELMSSPLREAILTTHANVKAFGNLSHVHEFTYGGAPEAFAISSYKTYVERGRTTFLRQVLQFEINLPGTLYPH